MTNPSPASPAQPISDAQLAEIRARMASWHPSENGGIAAADRRALLALVDSQSAEIARLREAMNALEPQVGWIRLVATQLHKQQRDYAIANTCDQVADAIDAALTEIAK